MQINTSVTYNHSVVSVCVPASTVCLFSKAWALLLQGLILQYRAVEKRRGSRGVVLSCTTVSSYYCPQKNERIIKRRRKNKTQCRVCRGWWWWQGTASL